MCRRGICRGLGNNDGSKRQLRCARLVVIESIWNSLNLQRSLRTVLVAVNEDMYAQEVIGRGRADSLAVGSLRIPKVV